MIGVSNAMQNIQKLISSVALSNSTILITGESGTEKEVVAAAIHEQSPRNKGSYAKLNCAAIPENSIESELFGHEKGAFTGADSKKTGKFQLANGGTILLDEIGYMPLSLLVTLLRVLQEREIEVVFWGGRFQIPVDVRILCSTCISKKNLWENLPGPVSFAKKKPSPPKSAVLLPPTSCGDRAGSRRRATHRRPACRNLRYC